MNIPTTKDCVLDGARVTFVRYQSGQLWYRCDNGFEFPVPVSDTGDGAFMPEDKASMYMRWIRQHIAMLQVAIAS